MKRVICSLYNGYEKSTKSMLAKCANIARREVKSCFAVCYAVTVSDDRIEREAPDIDVNVVYDINEGGYLFKADSYEEYRELVAQYLNGEPEREFKFWTVFNKEYQSSLNNYSVSDEIQARVEDCLDTLRADSIEMKCDNSDEKDIIYLTSTAHTTKLDQMCWIIVRGEAQPGSDKRYKKSVDNSQGSKLVKCFLYDDSTQSEIDECIKTVEQWIRRYK